MMRFPVVILFLGVLASAAAGTEGSFPDKVTNGRDFGDVRKEVETLRGKKFLREVPVYQVSEKALRAISDRELDKDFPGPKLRAYEELLAWLDMVPPRTDLKAASADFLVGQVAGLYDSDSKEMCIPSFSSTTTNAGRKAAERKLEELAAQFDDIIFAHEFTHALEDQHWPIEDPKDHDLKASTDHGTAHSFVLEGSATREMLEAIPAQSWGGSAGRYFTLWNLLHSGVVEWLVNQALGASWKGSAALVPGVPEALARSEAMPYGFGYSFCTRVMREWGLDGLDYIYRHPPVSSEQVMHPSKAWEWRDFPVQIDLPESLPGGWKQISLDIIGEAGMAVLFGCNFTNLNRGLELARGWDGDHVGLFEDPGGHRLLLWASSWDSTNAAGRYLRACAQERRVAHRAVVTESRGNRIAWESPDGRTGSAWRQGRRVILFETDNPDSLLKAESGASAIAFTEPPEDTARNRGNSALLRFNPLCAWQRDGDYTIARSVGGLLSRHDRNGVGAADTLLFGILAESRRTASFRKWELVGSFVARHESEARRGFTKTTLLPWGILSSYSSARLPQAPDKTIRRLTVLWTLGGSMAIDGANRRAIRVLPFGLLLRTATAPGQSSAYVLGTGWSRKKGITDAAATTRFRFFGIPIWTKRVTGEPAAGSHAKDAALRG